MGAPVEESEETYTDTSYPPWMIRWYRHKTTFKNPALRHHTTLATREEKMNVSKVLTMK